MLRIVLLMLLSTSAYALPERVELWFLSVSETSWLDSIIKNPYVFYSYTAQRNLQCQQMGEYCFDPQVGLYKRGEEGGVQAEIDLSKIEEQNKYEFMDPHKGVDRDLVACDNQGDFFDSIFCGETKKAKKKSKVKLQVWLDTSSTMRQIDYKGFAAECDREFFLRSLSETCPLNEKMKVYYFDEFLKQAGTFQRVCVSDGLNDMKRLVKDMKKATVKNLIIVTDIFEAESSFINAMEATGVVKIKGLEKPMYAKDLKKELKKVRKLCL